MSMNAFQDGEQARFSLMAFHFWGGGTDILFCLFSGKIFLSLLFARLNCQVGALEIPSERIYCDIAKDR